MVNCKDATVGQASYPLVFRQILPLLGIQSAVVKKDITDNRFWL